MGQRSNSKLDPSITDKDEEEQFCYRSVFASLYTEIDDSFWPNAETPTSTNTTKSETETMQS